MKPTKKFICHICQKHRGAALIVSMIFVLIFSALAVSMATMSGTNLQIADSQRKANRTLESAQSGLEVVRYLLDGMSVSETEDSSGRLPEVYDRLGDRLAETGMTSIVTEHDTNLKVIRILTVNLDSVLEKSFSCNIKQSADVDSILKAEVTGVSGQLNRRIIVDFNSVAKPIFDFGVATKGPLQMTGNVDLEGAKVDASVYIESVGQETALELIGKCTIAGDVTILDPCASVQLSDNSSIGGETGDAAMDNVFVGELPVEFPTPNPGYFQGYVGQSIDPCTYSTETIFENIRIPPNTNPTFSNDITLNGIVFIEVPNLVTFTGNTTITGIIIGNGDLNDNSAANRIIFAGTVDSCSVSELPPEFGDELRNETGTFLMAPGFSISFGGNFNTLNGVIAANGIEFFGDAGGTIDGSVLNYSDTPMTLSGNSDLIFQRSGTTEVPAGFEPELKYEPSSYSEVVL